MRRDKSRGAHVPGRVEPEVILRDWLRMYHPKVLKEWDEAWVVWMSLECYIKEGTSSPRRSRPTPIVLSPSYKGAYHVSATTSVVK
jgi:hypothetical protein